MHEGRCITGELIDKYLYSDIVLHIDNTDAYAARPLVSDTVPVTELRPKVARGANRRETRGYLRVRHSFLFNFLISNLA